MGRHAGTTGSASGASHSMTCSRPSPVVRGDFRRRGIFSVWVVRGLCILMVGAIAMHLKVNDPLQKFLPAFGMLALCVLIVLGG